VTVTTNKGKKKELVSVRISKASTQNEKKMRVLMYFGEHARELISPETALRFTQMLCDVHPTGHTTPDNEAAVRISKVLDKSDIVLFPLINVDGHNRVTHGSYCTRTNHRGVDLNRNWDDHWKHSNRRDTNSGRYAFSEDETCILRDSAKQFRPDMFVSIHSGALGMYTPFAYSTSRPTGKVEDQMVGVLKRLNPRYCNCDVGAAGKELNYLCPGTCLDYMFDKLKTPYAFAVEIWEGGKGWKRQRSSSFLEAAATHTTHTGSGHNHGHDHSHGLKQSLARKVDDSSEVNEHSERVSANEADSLSLGSCFIESSNHHSHRMHHSDRDHTHHESDTESQTGALFPPPHSSSDHTCLSSFNPTNVADYIATTDSWSHLLIELIADTSDMDARAPVPASANTDGADQ